MLQFPCLRSAASKDIHPAELLSRVNEFKMWLEQCLVPSKWCDVFVLTAVRMMELASLVEKLLAG